MKNVFALALIIFCGQIVFAQNNLNELNALTPSADYENITSKKLYSDSSVTSTVIWIKKNVPLHKHVFHTEQVWVLEGTGNMRVGNEMLNIKTGDLIVIPKNTPHGVEVTSDIPLKVLSIQAPEFNGEDRIIINE